MAGAQNRSFRFSVQHVLFHLFLSTPLPLDYYATKQLYVKGLLIFVKKDCGHDDRNVEKYQLW